jgi:Family of unknown function (DUF6283)
MKPRKQCKKCPWKVGTNPHDIPSGYREDKHRELKSTIAEPGALVCRPAPMMACHETRGGAELPCVGWMAQQLGDGNNIALRLRVITGQVDGNVETVGPQHATLEATLPKRRSSR